MFLTREPLPLLKRLRNWVWPRSGWRRAVSYHWFRLQRAPGTAGSIAAGFACGIAWSFTPLVGTHAVVAAALAWMIRGSITAALIGTLAVNPWTAAPIWFSTYYIGAWMLPGVQSGSVCAGDFLAMFVDMADAAAHLDAGLMIGSVLPILWPMLVGSLPVGLAAGLAVYFAMEPVIRRFQARRLARRMPAVTTTTTSDDGKI